MVAKHTAGVYTYTVKECMRPERTNGEQAYASATLLVSDGARLAAHRRSCLDAAACDAMYSNLGLAPRNGNECYIAASSRNRQCTWHVRDLRRRHASTSDSDDSGDESGADDSAPPWVAEADHHRAADRSRANGDAEESLSGSVDDPTFEANGGPRESDSLPVRRSERLREAGGGRRPTQSMILIAVIFEDRGRCVLGWSEKHLFGKVQSGYVSKVALWYQNTVYEI